MNALIKLIVIALLLLFIFIEKKSNAQTVLQRCDVNNLWQGSNTISINTSEKKEGVASIGFTGSGTDWFKKKFSQTDAGIDESGWFNFWLYVSDVSLLTGDGQVELTSSGGPDADEYSWQVSSQGLTNGWNYVQLQLSAANKTGSPDLNAINFFRIYQGLSGPITARLDDLRFTITKDTILRNDPLDIKALDFSTLDGKVMFGYQGWFAHPDDGSAWGSWRHWGTMQDAESVKVEIYPDMREYEPEEKYLTGLTFSDGRPVRVYSAYNRKTVMRHMKWLRDYDLDGVFLQRFYPDIVEQLDLLALRDTVTVNVMLGCERFGRTFVNMYDMTWRDHVIDIDRLIEDWKHLVDDLKITESPNYLWHRGKPLVALWGFAHRENLSVAQLEKVMDFFKNCPDEKYRATVMLGTNQDFHTNSSWEAALSRADVISPWSVGRYNSLSSHSDFIKKHILPGQDWCDQRNIDFMPVIWPGFSWYNSKRAGEYQKNQIPRDGGKFYWTQSTRTASANAKMIYIAMFDEVDEATAMYKLSETLDDSPAQGYWLTLNADGYDLPSDWYLRCAKLTTQVVRGDSENRIYLNTPPDGIDHYMVESQSTKCGSTPGKLTFLYPLIHTDSILEFSIDGGNTYPYSTPVGSAVIEAGELSSGVYDVWMRRSDGSMPTDLGSYTIFDARPDAMVERKKSGCGYSSGEILTLIGDCPYLGPVQISIDGGNNYNLTTVEGTWRYNIPGLAPGDYNIWIRWADKLCPTEIVTVKIEQVPPVPVTLYYSIDGRALVKAEGKVILGCPGKSLDIVAEPAEDSWTWSWSGDFNFEATGRNIRFADTLNSEVFGFYTKFYVSYVDAASGCELKNQEFVVRKKSDCTVGIEGTQLPYNGLRVYPNPVSDILYIEPGELLIESIDISDISGRQVYSQTKCQNMCDFQIDLSQYKAGIYLYKIREIKGESFYGRFIIN
ncbi:MAG: T9SS type A sorting domain-containing protein [Bacteroidales bacterium]|jgi:hypothetical protein|nr:T9SS type A sorting domain-containing protein [Bacteroidales bacterium]